MTEAIFSDYCDQYLVTWDKRATLRRLERFRPEEVGLNSAVYPENRQILLKNERVASLSDELRHKLMVLSAYQVMQAVAGIEVVVVTEICGKIACEDLGFDIPPLARQVALTVAADEAYHAYVANEFIADMERVTGIAAVNFGPDRLQEVPIINAVRSLRRAVSPEHQMLADVIAVCFAENFLTEDLYDLSKESVKDSIFQRIVREHLMDEGRHQQFFQKLLRYAWERLSNEQKDAISAVLPRFLDSFLMDMERMKGRDLELLEGVGFSAKDAKSVLADVYRHNLERWQGYKAAFSHAQPAYALLEKSGMLEHGELKKQLRMASWIR